MTGILSAAANTASQITGSSVSSAAATAQPGLSNGTDFTIVFILISLFITIAVPIVLILWGKIKYKGSLMQILSGILAFILFKLVLTNIVSMLVLPSYSDQNASSFEACVYVVIGVLCLEIGRFLFLLISRKKRSQFGNAITFGAGFCVMEALIIAVGFLIPYLAVAVSSGSIEGVYQELRIYVESANLIKGQEWRFLIKGFMCVVFCFMQVSVSVMMFKAVHSKNYWLALVPLLFDLLIMLPNRMSSFSLWYWGNLAVILPYLGIMTLISCLVAYYFVKDDLKAKKTDTITSAE